MIDPINQFKEAMYLSGISPPDLIEVDGKLRRFSSGDKGDKNGWYVFHKEGGIPSGAYGCWKKGINESWRADIGRPLTSAEASIHQASMEAVSKLREVEKLKLQAKAKEKALNLWNRASLKISHSYVISKQIKPYGIRQFENSLLIPLIDNGQIQSLQLIESDATKRFLTGGRVAGCYFAIGKVNDSKVLCICEGYATGASIHEATSYPVIVAFNAGNLQAVTNVMKVKYPNFKVIVCGDDDWKTEGNPGITKAKECNSFVVFPKFGSDRKDTDTDFNDMAIKSGMDAVRKVINSEQEVILLKASELVPKPIDWVWRGWLAVGKLHLLGGVAGTGKTTISLALVSVITTGGAFPDGSKALKGDVVIWTGEDDICDTLTPRLIAMNADLDKVHFIQGIKIGLEERPFDPSLDFPSLKEAIEKIGNVKLLIIDPIVSVVKGDSHKNAEVRKDLAPLVEMAESSGIAIIGITHFSKGTTGREPIERITGSLAFGAVARIVLVASKSQNDEGEDIRIFLRAKSNIGLDDGGFEYSLEQSITDSGIETSQVVWGSLLDGSARDLLGEAEEESEGGGVKGCMKLIHDLLSDGSVNASQMEKDCKSAGYSHSTTKRAKKKLGIKSIKSGMGANGAWIWESPKEFKAPKESHSLSLNPLSNIESLKQKSQIVEGEL